MRDLANRARLGRMSSEERVREAIDAINRGDVDGFLALTDANFESRSGRSHCTTAWRTATGAHSETQTDADSARRVWRR